MTQVNYRCFQTLPLETLKGDPRIDPRPRVGSGPWLAYSLRE